MWKDRGQKDYFLSLAHTKLINFHNNRRSLRLHQGMVRVLKEEEEE